MPAVVGCESQSSKRAASHPCALILGPRHRGPEPGRPAAGARVRGRQGGAGRLRRLRGHRGRRLRRPHRRLPRRVLPGRDRAGREEVHQQKGRRAQDSGRIQENHLGWRVVSRERLRVRKAWRGMAALGPTLGASPGPPTLGELISCVNQLIRYLGT